MIQTAIGCLFVLTIAFAMAIDVATFRIPNAVPAVLALLFACSTIASLQRVDWVGHFGAAMLVLALGAICFALRLMGGGDVKLLAGVALWFGWRLLPEYLLAVGLIGGLFGAVLLLTRPFALASEPYWARCGVSLPRILRPREPVPYGLAIGAAALGLIAMSGSFEGP
jgi:prepilin peptidase CpaA